MKLQGIRRIDFPMSLPPSPPLSLSLCLPLSLGGNRVEYTCSPPRTDRPHPHSNQTLLHTARNSLLNFNSLSSSATEMPWLVWHRQTNSTKLDREMFLTLKPVRKNSSSRTSKRLPRMRSDRKTIDAGRAARKRRPYSKHVSILYIATLKLSRESPFYTRLCTS